MEANKRTWILLLSGAISGAVNGLFGGGGGMIIVPLLICLCGYLRKNAHATALLVMLPVSIVSAISYLIKGQLDFQLTLPVTIGFSIGGAIGALILSKIKENKIKYLFSIMVLAAGVKLLFF